ncbi:MULTISPECIES: M14 family metallopeptidase [Alteromonas]|uniref:Peptidase M14 n=2 Tax=Alteromonas stellipolaris TaxID=233316 RepID=A0ABM5YNT7_9ALTE|nr:MULTISPECIES: M14 family metallopeptidase [Alteromonas]ALM92613.1 Secreted protein containing N-terminal Zinc-dependent carboxypeptidase [Alteromonas stellipolaris LMG 21856]AMJ76134.1 peptidase M14 [Alteromonas stellipolaris]AMJ88565.1 peptidase M14 [Alteromonas sp. Mac1]AMJ92419.1 peptidase M14 [Alteromonas sp. Mac2]
MLATLVRTATISNFPKWLAPFVVLTALCVSDSVNANMVALDKGGKPVQAYLPTDVTYNPDIPTPESVLGANIGQWHVRHDQLTHYMRVLADHSDRISLEVTGRTHENRELLLLTITAPSNRPNIESMRTAHINAMNSGIKVTADAPLIFYMGYSIHGNEPSGSNAALALAYYLAAGQGAPIDALLNNNIVLLDPSFNPDGLSRFAQWANMHKGKQLVTDSNNREHDEGWPSGRTNHYWFDLNRDWLLLAHPESQARIKQFHRWRPHILTDFHEMGTDSTYFFQPGVRSRKNPITPDENVTLTEALAAYHAKAFDKQGKLYFSEEAFDDFYAGKGSTYPDLHGSIGILFEQASSRGHLQESINGPLAFSTTISNQITTSLSTFEGALANKPAILDYQSAFVKDTQALAQDGDISGYIVGESNDSGRFNAMLSLLNQHNIKFEVVSKDSEIGKQTFSANRAIYIPAAQAQYRLITSIFSTQTSFENNTFYDVSSWNMAMAFNLPFEAVEKRDARSVKTAANAQLAMPVLSDSLPANAYAYAFSWEDYYAPALLQSLLEAGVSVRSSENAFEAKLVNNQRHTFTSGSIVIPTGLAQPDNLLSLLTEHASALNIPVYALASGLTPTGSDIGSRSIQPISAPKVLLVGGEGTSQYEVGEMWHYFDTRVGLPVSIVEQQKLGNALQSGYTHIVFASGRYSLSNDTRDALSTWVENGGVLIGQKSALRYFAANEWLNADILKQEEIDSEFDEDKLTFGDKSALYARKLVAGAVYEAEIDITHPLFYGYTDTTLPMFKTSNMVVNNYYTPFTTPARYTSAPLLAGFSDEKLVKLIAETPAVITTKQGKGVVIGFTDNTQFRGYWYGTNKMLSNAIYQSGFLK